MDILDVWIYFRFHLRFLNHYWSTIDTFIVDVIQPKTCVNRGRFFSNISNYSNLTWPWLESVYLKHLRVHSASMVPGHSLVSFPLPYPLPLAIDPRNRTSEEQKNHRKSRELLMLIQFEPRSNRRKPIFDQCLNLQVSGQILRKSRSF